MELVIPGVEFDLPWVCFVLPWVWLFCRELSLFRHNFGLSVTLCFVDVSFVVAVTPVDHRRLGLRNKINRAPGILGNWSRDPGSAMLFFVWIQVEKIQQYQHNCMIYFISGSQRAFKVPLQNSGAPGPRTKINRALGIPSNWSRNPDSAMLFCFMILDWENAAISIL